MMSVGGGARRIELGGNPHTFQKATLDLLRRGVVCKIAGHERKKVAAARPSCEDTFTIGARILDLRHRRHQVRHNDASREDRKSTRLNSVTNAHLVCRLLL